MTHKEKDKLIRSLLTALAPVAECVQEGIDDNLLFFPEALTQHDLRVAYAAYWMARAMGYRSDDRGSLALGVRSTTEDER